MLVEALAVAGIREPFPIQTVTLPDALAGRDILARGQTGSGKTLAFVLPLLTRLSASSRPAPRASSPGLGPRSDAGAGPSNPPGDRALLRRIWGFGRPPYSEGYQPGHRSPRLRRGVDIVVACPGRLEDLLRSGACHLGGVEICVIDEADHMADLGFLPSVRRILDQTPAGGQRLLYSATLDAAVNVLSDRYLSNPVRHSVDGDRALSPRWLTTCCTSPPRTACRCSSS